MPEKFDNEQLILKFAQQLGMLSDEQLAASIKEWSEGSGADLRDVVQRHSQINGETWDALSQLVCLHQQSQGLSDNEIHTLYHSSPVSDVVRQAIEETEDVDEWGTFLGVATAKPHDTSVESRPERDDIDQGAVHFGGRFQKLRQHAAGGLGQVFVAIDDELNRQVALKQIQSRFAGDQDARQRFMLEAEITGGLEHPGVVPVYGLGLYKDGQPYYAMRFVRGESMQAAIKSLHQQASGQGLWPANPEQMFALRKLLARLIDVCQAIGYAHSRGVLHRDIKPDNIMLGKFGETLVVDWGLAKVYRGGGEPENRASTADDQEPYLNPASGDTAAPREGGAVGTIGFMSPEQASGVADQQDARSDIYALGASLYALLLGQPSIGGSAEEKPKSISQLLADVRAGRYRRPLESEPAIPKPLAAICQRAMALDPANRYESAVALADDLERWLADEPVSAYQETARERARRWVRRHQTLATTLATVVFVSILGLGTFSLVLNRKNVQLGALADSLQTNNLKLQERRKQLQDSNQKLSIAEAKARDEAATAIAVTEFLNDDLLARASSQDHPDPKLEVRTVLERAATELETKFAERPLVKAQLLKTIGIAFGYLGEFEEAERALATSVQIYAEQLGENHEMTLARQGELAAVIAKSGQYERGQAALEAALERLTRLHGAQHKAVIEAQAELADLYTWMGDYERAETLIEQAIAGNTQLSGANDADTLSGETTRVNILNYTSRFPEALLLCESLVERCQAHLGEQHMVTLEVKTALAQSHYFSEQWESARESYQEALQLSSRLLGEQHPHTLAVRHDIANLDAQEGRPGQALAELKRIRIDSLETFGENHRETIIHDRSIAEVLAQLGRLTEARDLLLDALGRANRSLAKSPETQFIRFELAQVYFELEQYERAEPILKSFVEAQGQRQFPGDTSQWDAQVLLAQIRSDDEQYVEAIALLSAARAGYAASRVSTTTWLPQATSDLLWCYVLNDQTELAEALLEELIGDEPLQRDTDAEAMLTFADALIEVEQFDAAEMRLDELTAWADRQVAPSTETLRMMLDLAATLGYMGRFEEAIARYEWILNEQLERLGAENIDTLETLDSLAVTLDENEEYEEAVQSYQLLLDGQKKVYGAQSRQAMQTLESLADLNLRQGMHREAIGHLLEVQAMQQAVGADDEMVRKNHRWLADAYRRLPDISKAIQHYEAALDGIPVDEDESTLLSFHQLAWCYNKDKQFDAAILTYQQVVAGRTRLLGETHQHTFVSLGNLAHVMANQHHPLARQTLQQLEALIEVSETNAPGVATAMYMLGESYRSLLDYAPAVRWYQACVQARSAALDPEHADTLLAMHQLAYTHSLSGDRTQAVKVYAEVVPLREKALGELHEYTLLSLNNWGVDEALMQNYDKAIELLEEGVQRVVKAKGMDDALAIRPRMTLASAHYLKGNYTRAIQRFRETLEVTYRRVREPNDQVKREIAMLQIVLADSEIHAGRLDDAFLHATEGLLTPQPNEPNPIDYFRAHSILGEVHTRREEFSKAAELLNKAMDGYADLQDYPLPEKRLRLQIDTAQRLVDLYTAQENPELANQWQSKRDGLQQSLDSSR